MDKPAGGVLNSPLWGEETVTDRQMVPLASQDVVQRDKGDGVSLQGAIQAFHMHKAVPNMGQNDRHEVMARGLFKICKIRQ